MFQSILWDDHLINSKMFIFVYMYQRKYLKIHIECIIILVQSTYILTGLHLTMDRRSQENCTNDSQENTNSRKKHNRHPTNSMGQGGVVRDGKEGVKYGKFIVK